MPDVVREGGRARVARSYGALMVAVRRSSAVLVDQLASASWFSVADAYRSRNDNSTSNEGAYDNDSKSCPDAQLDNTRLVRDNAIEQSEMGSIWIVKIADNCYRFN